MNARTQEALDTKLNNARRNFALLKKVAAEHPTPAMLDLVKQAEGRMANIEERYAQIMSDGFRCAAPVTWLWNISRWMDNVIGDAYTIIRKGN